MARKVPDKSTAFPESATGLTESAETTRDMCEAILSHPTNRGAVKSYCVQQFSARAGTVTFNSLKSLAAAFRVDPDLYSDPEIVQAIHGSFIRHLQAGLTDTAKEIYDRFQSIGWDFDLIPGFQAALRKGLLRALHHCEPDGVRFVLDLVPDAAWLSSPAFARSVKNKFVRLFEKFPPEAIARVYNLIRGRISIDISGEVFFFFSLLLLNSSLGEDVATASEFPHYFPEEFAAFRSSSVYEELIVAFAGRRLVFWPSDPPADYDYPVEDLRRRFEGFSDLRHPRVGRLAFGAPTGDPCRRMLFEFESVLIYFKHHFRERTRLKIIELGSPSGDLAELSEENQAKIQAFAANLHTELSVKVRAIASPELIAAYLQENGGGAGSEFLTQVA